MINLPVAFTIAIVLLHGELLGMMKRAKNKKITPGT